MVAIKKKNEDIVQYLYYSSTDVSSAGIVCFNHDKSTLPNGKKEQKIGVTGLEVFDKYEVDILGSYHKINKEQRKGGKKQSK